MLGAFWEGLEVSGAFGVELEVWGAFWEGLEVGLLRYVFTHTPWERR